MRKITKKTAKHFAIAKPISMSNSTVTVLPNVTIYSLFGNPIAYLYNDPSRELMITNAGYRTATTKERLNGILQALNIDAYIFQKNNVWYLNYKGIVNRIHTSTITFNQVLDGNHCLFYQVEKMYRS